jgi:hypothetical protein
MTERRDAADRVLALKIGGARSYLYPEDADPAAMWQVPVGTIAMWRQDQDPDETPGDLVRCPECATTDGLLVCGRWGDAATLLCPCGHEWTPGPSWWGEWLLRTAIGQTIQEHGLPEASLRRHPTP